MRNTIYISILILLSFNSCIEKVQKTDNRTDAEIDSLIQIHENDLIFLNFWKEMTELDFEKVLELENKKGNLTDGKFTLNLGSDKIDFNVKQYANYISLNFEDEYTITKNTGNPRVSGESEYNGYDRLIEKIEEHFDSKYIREIIPNVNGKTKGYDFFGNLINPPNRIWISSNGSNKKVFWMGETTWYNDKSGFSFSPLYIGEKELLASCKIIITICSYDTFLIEQEFKKKENTMRKKEEELKKKNKKNHNDLL